VVATRWWWVRHAPVRGDGGNIYGQKDMPCDCSDSVRVRCGRQDIARDAVWFASKAAAHPPDRGSDLGRRLSKTRRDGLRADLNEQNLGDWQGLNRAEFFASRPINVGSYWFAPIDEPSPNGESFMDLYNRVRRAVERINAQHAGRDIIAVAHGGTIKAAIGIALGDQPEKGLAFTIDIARSRGSIILKSDGHSGWRIPSSTSSPGSPTPRTPRCIKPADRKWCL